MYREIVNKMFKINLQNQYTVFLQDSQYKQPTKIDCHHFVEAQNICHKEALARSEFFPIYSFAMIARNVDVANWNNGVLVTPGAPYIGAP